jgi:hypothetical protein
VTQAPAETSGEGKLPMPDSADPADIGSDPSDLVDEAQVIYAKAVKPSDA